jgi:hypothetical protein
MRQSIATLLIILFVMGAFIGCSLFGSYKTRIKVIGGGIPNFELSGSGTMIDFTIYGPKQRPGEGREAFIVWKLIPIDTTGDSDLGDLDDIGSIKYGTVPKGYKQVYPENNSPPLTLKEGESYMLQVMTNNAPWGQIAFEIRSGKAVEKPFK